MMSCWVCQEHRVWTYPYLEYSQGCIGSDLAPPLGRRLGLPWWLSGSQTACSAGDIGDVGLIPGSGRSPKEAMATPSSILVRKTPWTQEPGGPQSMGLQRVKHNWATNTHFFTFPSFLFGVPFLLCQNQTFFLWVAFCTWKHVFSDILYIHPFVFYNGVV